ncbi:peptidase S8/S53 domain-containing protein [Halteromyces radiatus]|uniref:peptidase S8/S53 domain-containing protein n=1 Tax=Halteromyces radiatus TaxID=101107 RepID=UPI0022207868|nr:peptidase S8/S53 domain-containing protein [Halteromyces radiatus]KAI8097513.1 peptidase S8/S53 domain-containing protein [Halteromyces radiatus]
MKKRDSVSNNADHYYAQSQWQLEPIRVGESFMAMTGRFEDAQFLDYLRRDNGVVEYVEPNQYYQADMILPSNTKTMSFDDLSMAAASDTAHTLRVSQAANWGLSRITHRVNTDLSSYSYHDNDGQGVHVYVLDSGINVDHSDFGGRATSEINFVSNEPDDDMGGHGTHVAGKIGGKQYGVAKGVSLHAVKILDKSGMGTTSGLIHALSHVIDIAPPGKSLINLSLSGPKSNILNEVLKETTEVHNIPVFVSAGNSGSDACYFSPSSSEHVFAVGATDIHDRVPNYSDIGECVSIYAPGSSIKSTWIGSKDATQVLDGTSMANPHVVGIAAILMAEHSYESVKDLYAALRSMATADALTFSDKVSVESASSNLLAYHSPTN